MDEMDILMCKKKCVNLGIGDELADENQWFEVDWNAAWSHIWES